MNVYLTIDVETYTGDYDRDVFGHGLGLKFILDKCREHRVRATFFVEALGATQWGMDGVREIVDMIMCCEQEVQLHVHPSVVNIEGFVNHDDLLYSCSIEEQRNLLEMGLEILTQCNVEASAFRAGDLAADRNTMDVMRALGLKISSNRDRDVKSSIKSRVNDYFPIVNDVSERDGITDLPVTTLLSPLAWLDGKYRHLQICALGAKEMIDALERLREAGCHTATILMHPGEFYYMVNGKYERKKKNCDRLERLLDCISNNKYLNVKVMSEGIVSDDFPKEAQSDVSYNLRYSCGRVLEQGLARVGLCR